MPRAPNDMSSSEKTQRFLTLYHSEHPRLYALIRALLITREDADEVFQETCLALWQHFDEFTPGTNFSAWAATIARHRVLAYRKRNGSRPCQFSDAMLAQLANNYCDDLVFFESQRQALAVCIDKLRPKDRTMLQQRIAAAGPVLRLAEQLGRPLESVYKSLQRIRRQLRECVQRRMQLTENSAREKAP